MSGSMRVYLQADVEVQKHDHLDLIFGDLIMRYHDPRRFGFVAYFPDKESAFAMPELQRLGVEPLSEDFNSKFFLWSSETDVSAYQDLPYKRRYRGRSWKYLLFRIFILGRYSSQNKIQPNL